jgi:drug/metabolite transporter (DMT)-like permease
LAYLILASSVVIGTIALFVYKAAMTANVRRLPMLAVERLTIAILVCIYALVSSEGDTLGSEIVILALVGGVSVAVLKLLLLTAIRLGPAGLSWTILNLSICLPVLFSIAWGERPTAWQISGLLLVPVCIVLMGHRNDPGQAQATTRGWLLCILISFLLQGIVGTTFALVKELDLAASRHMFILLLNFVGVVVLAGATAARSVVPQRLEVWRGIQSGLCFSVAMIFWIEALMMLPGIVFFPIATVFGVILAIVTTRLAWNERLNPSQLCGLALALAAIVMISAG